MKRILRRRPAYLYFLFLLFLIGLSTFPKASALLPMYVSSDLRQEVQAAVSRIADENGWLLSDISFVTADRTFIRFLHVPHSRFPGESRCYDFFFDTSSLVPCDA